MINEVTHKYTQLNTKQLKVDMDYQRDLDPKRVKSIAEHFNPHKVNAIKVSHRDGAYWIFDGQHTAKVLILRNGNEDLMVECKVYEGLTKEEEAELFARQNEYEKKVPKNSEMKALYAAKDVEITELKRLVESCGFIFDFSKNQATNRIVCCDLVYKIFQKSRENDFRAMLSIIKSSWNGLPESLRKEIIGGMYVFYSTYKDEFDNEAAIRKFSKTNPIEIYRDGKVYSAYPGNSKYAYVLTTIYNKGQRKEKLDPTKLTTKS